MSVLMLKSGTIFDGVSPQTVSSYVKSHIGNHSLELLSNPGNAMLCYKKFGDLGLSQLTYGANVIVSTATGLDQTYHLQVVMEGSCKVHYSESEAVLLTPGKAALINPMDPVSIEYSDDCVKLIINLPTSLINRCYSDQFGYAPLGGLQFGADAFHLDEDSPFSKMLELLFLEADQPALTNTNRAVSTSMGLLVATKLMEVFPHDIQHSSVDDEFFRMIDSFIDAHARSEITAEALARLSNVSVRTLYDRFKRSKRVSPNSYIKERRLRRIYNHIQTATSRVRNVTEVALEFGFSHLGRFSSEYKRLFGELPSETLRRRNTSTTTQIR